MSAKNGENKDDNIIICRCEEITRLEILDAIAEGYTALCDIRRRTRAGMGLCQGNTCSKLIRKLVTQETKLSPHELSPARARPPVRPLAVESLIKGNDQA